MFKQNSEVLREERQLRSIITHVVNGKVPEAELGDKLLYLYDKFHVTGNCGVIFNETMPKPNKAEDFSSAVSTSYCLCCWLLRHDKIVRTHEPCEGLVIAPPAKHQHYQFYHDKERAKIILQTGDALDGTDYKIFYALLEKFQKAHETGHDVEYMTTVEFAEKLGMLEGSLQRAISRLRNKIAEYYYIRLGIVLNTNDFIENPQHKGYRLNRHLQELKYPVDLAA